jgi:histidinol-phosphatase (PHP family)
MKGERDTASAFLVGNAGLVVAPHGIAIRYRRSVRSCHSQQMLPCDTHVHSEWSWDTGGPSSDAAGRMEQTCVRAVQLGLPVLVFTEHLDFATWTVDSADFREEARKLIGPDGVIRPPVLDIEGYLDSVGRCRRHFPNLRILTGVELGQPHLEVDAATQFLDRVGLDRVIGSLHNVPVEEHRYDMSTLYRMWSPDQVIWEYLAEVCRMIDGPGRFDVLTHVDFAVRYWPERDVGPFDPTRFEDGFRRAMRGLADTGRALELNVGGGIRPWIPQWWCEEGGRTISFGSDAHEPHELARNFPEAAAMATHFGFRPRSDPAEFWTR